MESYRKTRTATIDPSQESTLPSNSKPWSADGGETFGSWLRQQREIRNIRLREIADRTNVGMRYLEAFEENRFELLPAPLFARGFLREYAKYVGLDPDEVVNYYLTESRQQSDEEPEESEGPADSGRGLRLVVVLVVIIALIAAIVAGLAWVNQRRAESETAERPSIAPPVVELPRPQSSATAVSPATNADAGEADRPSVGDPAEARPGPAVPTGEDGALVVVLSFTDECWVEARVDGAFQVSELRVQGESMQLEAEDEVVLTLGNAAAVRIEVGGEPLPIEAGPGQVVSELVIDRSTLGPRSDSAP